MQRNKLIEIMPSGKWMMLTAIFFGLIFITQAQMRGRVQIQNGNLVADNGTTLRASPFFMSIFDVPDMQDNEDLYREYFREVSQTYHMNAIRISPWIGNWEYDVKNSTDHFNKYTYMVDKVVDWCEEDGIYAIVNMHIAYGTEVDVDKVKDFWSVMAPRYKDKTHVVFEALNEPDEPTAKSNMGEVYTYLRGQAPDTHIILWSPNNARKISLSDIEAQTAIDYSNASFGFHVYEWYVDKPVEWEHAAAIRDAGYPVICTEFFSLTNANDMPIDWAHLMDNIDYAEQYGMSWMNWGPFAHYRGVNKSDWTHDAIAFDQEFLDKLTEEGIAHWPADNGSSNGGFPNPNKWYVLKNKDSGLNMRNEDCGKANETKVELYNGTGNCAQWRFIEKSNGIWTIQNRNSGLNLRHDGESVVSDQTLAELWPDNGGRTDFKIVASTESGYYHIQHSGSGVNIRNQDCADVNDQTRIEFYNGTGNCARWQFIEMTNVRLAEVSAFEPEIQSEMSIYPNPATDYFQVVSDRTYDIMVYGMNGQTIIHMSGLEGVQRVATEGMDAGMYLIQVRYNDGTIKTSKLILN